MPESFYEVLDVPRDADEETITDAYRDLVKDVHPDVSDRPDAADRFKLVQRAEEVLTDDAKRSRYDRMGHERYVRLNGNPELHDFEEDGEDDGPGSRSDIQDAAARAAAGTAESTGGTTHSSGPTNEGATAGWRERERRWRRTTGSPNWNFGDDGGGFGEQDDPFGNRWEYFTGRDDEDTQGQDPSGTGGAGGTGDPFESHKDGETADGAGGGSAGSTGGGSAGNPGAGSAESTGAGSTGRTTAGRTANPWADATRDESGAEGATASTTGAGGADGSGFGGAGVTTSASRSDGGSPTGRTGYAVNDWSHDTEGRSVVRTDWSQESAGFFVGSFLMYPIMLATSVYPGFPFEVNLVIGACTLFMAGYLLTRPGISAIVFGVWGLLLPVVIVWSGFSFVSLFGLIALVGTWIPFAYALAIGVVLSDTL